MHHPHRLHCIEALEARIAPASLGGVMSGTTLKLSALSPTLGVSAGLVQVDADSFDLFDGGTTTRFDGVKNIQVLLSDVADDFDLILLNPAHRGSIVINTGLGADSVDLLGNGATSGDVTINSTGTGLITFAPDLSLRGNTKVNLADGGFVQTAAQHGNLTITGATVVGLNGAIAGNVKVTAPDGGLQMTAAGLINGALTVAGGLGAETLAITAKVDGKIRFAAGEGGSSFSTSGGFAAGNSVTVVGGSGPDTVNMALGSLDPFSTTVSGAMVFSLGAGDNGVTITGTGRIAGGVRVSTTDGNDTVNVNGFVTIVGATQFALGEGNNTANVANAQLAGAFKYAGGAGTDDLDILNTALMGAARITLGDGANTVTGISAKFDNALYVKGGVGADSVIFAESTIFGKATFVLGDGTNQLLAGAQLRGGFAYQGGAGDDTLSFPSETLFGGTGSVKAGDGTNILEMKSLSRLTSFTYTGGVGADVVTLESAGGPFARIKVALGDGNDLAFVRTANFHSLRVDGGLGVDSIERIAAAITAGLIDVNFETQTTV